MKRGNKSNKEEKNAEEGDRQGVQAPHRLGKQHWEAPHATNGPIRHKFMIRFFPSLHSPPLPSLSLLLSSIIKHIHSLQNAEKSSRRGAEKKPQ